MNEISEQYNLLINNQLYAKSIEELVQSTNSLIDFVRNNKEEIVSEEENKTLIRFLIYLSQLIGLPDGSLYSRNNQQTISFVPLANIEFSFESIQQNDGYYLTVSNYHLRIAYLNIKEKRFWVNNDAVEELAIDVLSDKNIQSINNFTSFGLLLEELFIDSKKNFFDTELAVLKPGKEITLPSRSPRISAGILDELFVEIGTSEIVKMIQIENGISLVSTNYSIDFIDPDPKSSFPDPRVTWQWKIRSKNVMTFAEILQKTSSFRVWFKENELVVGVKNSAGIF